MPNPGTNFRDAIIEAILGWNLNGLRVYREAYVGSRFIDHKRKIDIVLNRGEHNLGIEAKTQQGSGTAEQKLLYTAEDARITPIPMIIVFSGGGISMDIKALLLSKGIGLELKWTPEAGFIGNEAQSGLDILKQRIQIELGLDWLADQEQARVDISGDLYDN